MKRSGTCKRILRHLDAFLENRLAPDRSREIREHLENCVSCREERDRRTRLQTLLEEILVLEPAPPDFAESVMRSIRHEAAVKKTRDWGWLDLAVRLVASGAFLAISGWIGWLLMAGISPEVWLDVPEQQVLSVGQSASLWWDAALMRAKQEWMELVQLPAGMWGEIHGLREWWSHPFVPAAVLFSFTGLAVWSKHFMRTGETAS